MQTPYSSEGNPGLSEPGAEPAVCSSNNLTPLQCCAKSESLIFGKPGQEWEASGNEKQFRDGL